MKISEPDPEEVMRVQANDTTSTMLNGWASVLWIMSRSILTEVHLGLRTSSLYLFANFNLVFDTNYWLVVCILWYCLYISPLAVHFWWWNVISSPHDLWKFHFIACWFRVLLHRPHNVSVSNCCCSPWQACLMSGCQYTGGFFLL